MFEHETALVAAGNQLALEWTKLEAAGVDPATLKETPAECADERYLPFIRLRDRFFVCVAACELADVPIGLRYRVWLSSDCCYNPGMTPPAFAIASLLCILVIIAFQTVGFVMPAPMSGGVLILLSSVVILTWDKVWAYTRYLKLLKLSKRVA